MINPFALRVQNFDARACRKVYVYKTPHTTLNEDTTLSNLMLDWTLIGSIQFLQSLTNTLQKTEMRHIKGLSLIKEIRRMENFWTNFYLTELKNVRKTCIGLCRSEEDSLIQMGAYIAK